MNHKQEVIQTILEVADEFNENLEYKIAVEKGEVAALFGREGVLDSLGLVSFVMAVEQALEDKTGVALTLADEKAMSQRNSPFRTVGTLADYATGLIQGAA
jgi:D-alanine--poly(phosphoribitol) ligase subunit 2